MIEPTMEARQLAERALRGAEYDWESLFAIRGEGVIFAGAPRHGVRCLKRVGSHEVIAERLHLSRPTFYRRLQRGLTPVAERLDELGEFATRSR
jgi:hypothetical protein